ncbi:hypothetical protein niasHT_027752 [Heterodera trifolii]|uniref:Uncharacterized protein n=1 Tax=Heterodera trifolii TaxID=157864 RepID=A0ABD2KIV8_9BILA
MKYDSRFGDAFWNSSDQSYFRYLLQMMTSWALICHVWYLPLMTKEVGKRKAKLGHISQSKKWLRFGTTSIWVPMMPPSSTMAMPAVPMPTKTRKTMATETAPTRLNKVDSTQNDTDELID